MVDAIVDGKVKNREHVSGIAYMSFRTVTNCGLGDTPAAIKYGESHRDPISEKVLAALKTTTNLRWTNPLAVKVAIEHAFTEKFDSTESAKGEAKVQPPLFYVSY
jgi:glutaminyl-tRNA synthetase